MGPESIAVSIPIAGFAAMVLIVYFGMTRKHSENVELIKRGINPEKYQIKLPGRLGLPWGIIFAAFGLGFLIPMLISGEFDDIEEIGLFLACVIAGIGLIIYWKVTAADRERALKIKETLILRNGTDFQPDPQPEKAHEE